MREPRIVGFSLRRLRSVALFALFALFAPLGLLGLLWRLDSIEARRVTRGSSVRRRWLISIASAGIAIALAPAWTATAKPKQDVSRPPIVDPRAAALLREMGSYLAQARQFTFRADIAYDHVLPTRQKIQLAAVGRIVGNTGYWEADGVYYRPLYSGSQVVYQIVANPS